MSKPSSAVKRKYNEKTYQRYEFSVRLDSELNSQLMEYKSNGGNVSELIKKALEAYLRPKPQPKSRGELINR